MTAPTKLTGVNGVVSFNGVQASVADFTLNIKRGTAAQSRVGSYSDRKIAGKVDITGSLTNLDIVGDNIGRLLAASGDVAAETKIVMQACDASNEWTSSDPVNTVLADETTIKKEGTGALKITTGALSLNDTVYVTTLVSKDLTGHHYISFWIRSALEGSARIKVGMGETAITDNEHTINIIAANQWQHEYWDVSSIADASKNAIDNLGFTILSNSANTIYIDDINSYKGVRVGAGHKVTIYGDATDGVNNAKLTCTNCIITGGSMKFGDADAYIDGPIEFTVADPDTDLTLDYT